jgi:hypothetical protein
MMHDKPSEELMKYYGFDDKKDKKRLSKRKKSLKNKRDNSSPNTDKEQWLNGDGPQTD